MSFYLRLVHTELPYGATEKIAGRYVEFKNVLSTEPKITIILSKFVLHFFQTMIIVIILMDVTEIFKSVLILTRGVFN